MCCYIWYSEEGTGRGPSPPRPLLAVPNVTTAHPSTASVPITVLLYNGPLLCGFNVPVKGLTFISTMTKLKLNYNIIDNKTESVPKNTTVSITSDATLWAELANCRHENFCSRFLRVASVESTRKEN